MKRTERPNNSKLIHADYLSGFIGDVWGNAGGLRGNVSEVYGDVTNLYGAFMGLKGDVSGLKGYISYLSGDATGLVCDLDALGISTIVWERGMTIDDIKRIMLEKEIEEVLG
jgi:hypothetical protein